MAGIFNYRFKEKYQSKTCVVKFWFGTKYFIWKSLHLHASCEQVFRDLNRKIGNGCKETDLFYKVIQHIKRSRVGIATVEVLYMSDILPDILAFDRAELDKCATDPNCLNLNFDQYIPKWLQNVTANKALQATEIVKTSDTTSGDVISQPVPKKAPTVEKLPVVDADISDIQSIAKEMAAQKGKVNGK